jgi:hypothetical protein
VQQYARCVEIFRIGAQQPRSDTTNCFRSTKAAVYVDVKGRTGRVQSQSMLSTRVEWASLPVSVHEQIETLLGASVTSVTLVDGGFSPGFIARIEGANHQAVFAKLCSTAFNPRTPTMHAREADVLRCLPAMSSRPHLVGIVVDQHSGWSGLVTSFIEGNGLSTSLPDVEAAFTMLQRVTSVGVPNELRPLEVALADDFLWFGLRRLLERDGSFGGGWSDRDVSRLLSCERYLPAALQGDELVHGDMRADNVIVDASGQAVAVDWPAAARGNAVFDVLMLCASVAQQAGERNQVLLPGDLLGMNDRCRAADPEMITVLLAGLYGHYHWASTLGDPPGIGGVRLYQSSMATTLAAWLSDRLR